ncbi:MAG: nitroreductase family protein, partial [Bilophila sp.]
MDTLEAIYTRRSIRTFTPEPVDETIVKELLSAAMAAPTAGNIQDWRFIVINDRAKLDAIAEAHPFAKMAKDAPL